MKINFTKKEFRALLELASIGDAIIHAHCAITNETKPYLDICEKLKDHAKEMGCEDWIETADGETQFNDRFYDHISDNFISEYDENVFWDYLVRSLSMRDVKRYNKIDIREDKEAYLDALVAHSKKYESEFDDNGIENLEVVNRRSSPEG